MAKKLVDIARYVDESNISFMEYLNINISEEALSIIDALSKSTELYIFSGVIRNFFLKNDSIRDIDLILKDEIDIDSFFDIKSLHKNSYGGFKFLSNPSIDFWFLEKTWAFRHQTILKFDLEKYIPSTAFFNFSSIVFSYNQKRFFATNQFLRFLRDKEIDVVYKPNANYPLCVINSLYYADKYGLKLSDNLKRHLLRLHKQAKVAYEVTQLKHFGSILYSNEQIESRIASFVFPVRRSL